MHLLTLRSVAWNRAMVYFIILSMLATSWLITYTPLLLSFLSSGFPGCRILTLTFQVNFPINESPQYIFIGKNLEYYKWKENGNTSQLIIQRCNVLPRGPLCCFTKSGLHVTPHFLNCFPSPVYGMLWSFSQVNKSSSALPVQLNSFTP